MATEAGTRSKIPAAGLPKPRIFISRRARVKTLFRFGWGLADQVVSSLTNTAVSIYLVHVLGAAEFGAFGLSYVTYGFALNASRGLATDPLMVRFSDTNVAAWRRAVAICTGTAVIVGLVAGTCVLAAAAVLGGTLRAAFLALGLTLPGLLLQDSWRYSFFALGRGVQAFLNDMIWAACLLPSLLILRETGHASVFWAVLAWGLSACVGAIIGPLQARVVPKFSGAWQWVSRHGDLGFRYLAEGTASSVSLQLRGYGMGLILGLAAVGYVQAVSTLIGPMTILALAMSLVLIPEGVRVLRRGTAQLRLFCLFASIGLAAIAISWAIVLLVFLPRGLGSLLLGPVWIHVYPLVLPTMVAVVGSNAGIGAGVGLHALGAAKRSLNMVIFGTVSWVAFSLVGAAEWGAAGALWGTALALWTSLVPTWWQFHKAIRDHDSSVPGGSVGHVRRAQRNRTGKHSSRRRLVVGSAGFHGGLRENARSAVDRAYRS
jgi:O-antigen/teichoic acid export membrane protein